MSWPFTPQETRELNKIARGLLRDAKKMIKLAKKLAPPPKEVTDE